MDDLFENPPFTLTAIWHPDCLEGKALAARLFERFRGEVFQGCNRETGIPVAFRSDSAAGTECPPPIPLPPDRCHAVVLLVDDCFRRAAAGPWQGYLDDLVGRLRELRKASLLYPVALQKEVFSIHPDISGTHFIRLYEWEMGAEESRERLASELTPELCRLIAPWVAAVEQGGHLPPQVSGPPDPLRVFISHSKHDGVPLAERVRDILHHTRVKTFFDVYDIPPGWGFEDVIQGEIHRSGLLVVQTDSYASREFCRMEVLTARRFRVPVVVLNAVRDREPRAFPYAGNVPVIMARDLSDARLGAAIDSLFDEFLKDLFWRLHRKFFEQLAPGALLLPHAPDLLSVVNETERPAVVVHPGPPLGDAESGLLRLLVPGLRLETPTSLYTRRSVT